MKCTLFYFVLLLPLLGIAANDIEYDFQGITIKNNKIIFDGMRWDLVTKGNRSIYSQKDHKNIKVEVVRDNSDEIIGVAGYQSVTSTFNYMFKDSIIRDDCGDRDGRASQKVCVVNHELCQELDQKTSAMQECLVKHSKVNIRLPEISDQQREIFPILSDNEILKTRIVKEITVTFNDNVIDLMSQCAALKAYSKPNVLPVKSATPQGSSVVPQ